MKHHSHNTSYLIFDPSVFIKINGSDIFLYNSINGAKLNYTDSSIAQTLSNGSINNNSFTFNEISKNQDEFISLVEKNEIGFFVETNNSIQPTQFSPIPNIEQDNIDAYSDQKIADEALLHIDEISIYLNSTIHNSADEIFEYSYKQTLSNRFNLSNEILNESELIEFIQPVLNLKNIKRINLLGGNIFINPSLTNLFSAFESLNGLCQFCLYLNYFDFELYMNHINKIRSFNNLKFVFCITSKTNENEIAIILKNFNGNEVEFNCLIESENDVNHFESLLDNVSKVYTPIYNGNNYQLFSENVFLEKDDIYSIIINQNEVFSRMKLNTNNYGKLTILSNGEVYSNINKLSVGNIKTNNISEIVFNEIKHKNNWLLTRNDVAPCSNCNYNFLCPPISNYEFVLNKFNLCHIKK